MFTAYKLGAIPSVLKIPGKPACQDISNVRDWSFRALSPDDRLTDFVMQAKWRAEEQFGVYPQRATPDANRRISGGTYVPCTTVATILKMSAWLIEQNAKGGRGISVTQEKQQLADIRQYRDIALGYLDAIAARNNIAKGSKSYNELALGLFLPFEKVDGFWQVCLNLARRKDIESPGIWSEFEILAMAFWDRTQVVVKKIYKAAAKTTRGLFDLLDWFRVNWKTVAIILGALFGGYIVLQFA